jgi:hypothetical protein
MLTMDPFFGWLWQRRSGNTGSYKTKYVNAQYTSSKQVRTSDGGLARYWIDGEKYLTN